MGFLGELEFPWCLRKRGISMLLKIQWGKEEIAEGGIFKIRKINFIKNKKRKGEENLLIFW